MYNVKKGKDTQVIIRMKVMSNIMNINSCLPKLNVGSH